MIGICGCESGCGTTHLSIALANYAASKHGLRIACLELHPSDAFTQLSTFTSSPLSSGNVQSMQYFTIYDVDYYPLLQKQDIPALMNAGYDYLILDFGPASAIVYDELLRCDHKLVLGSLAPWRQMHFYDFCQKFLGKEEHEYFCFLVLHGEMHDILTFSKKCRISRKHIFSIPFIQNPFHITKEQFSFLEKLL